MQPPLFSKILKLDWLIILSVLFLNSLGLLSLYSQNQHGVGFSYFQKQLIFFGVGFFLMFLFSFFDWRVFKDNSYLVLFLYLGGIILLAGIFVFAPQIRGVKSWYKIGPLSFNPTEFTKLVLIILFAKYFSQRHIEMYKFHHIILSGIYLFIPAFLIYLQPDLGSVLVFLFIWFGILIVSGIKIKHFFILVLAGTIFCVFAWNFLLKEYHKERIISFLFPEYEPLETGWSQRQAKIALGSGGLFGKGFKKGPQTQYGFLPESHTDFIFSSIGEEFGFLTLAFLLICYILLLWRILKISTIANSNFARLFSLGVFVWLLSQIVINIGSNIGFLPVIGISLPFISYGGSLLLSLYIAIGILQGIKLHSYFPKSNPALYV
ncbi:MAG: rod shape-determining protein RodA [Candidatus Pacebacteria bacterium]|nr:rod shape-determining protein RodA [Candidatus Paceibacterota bacterium]